MRTIRSFTTFVMLAGAALVTAPSLTALDEGDRARGWFSDLDLVSLLRPDRGRE
jgi:hypothetical protein